MGFVESFPAVDCVHKTNADIDHNRHCECESNRLQVYGIHDNTCDDEWRPHAVMIRTMSVIKTVSVF